MKEAPDLVLVLSCVETSVVDPDPDSFWSAGSGSALGYGSESKRAKMTHKKVEKIHVPILLKGSFFPPEAEQSS